MARGKKKTPEQDVVKLTVTLRSGAEFELAGTRYEAQAFHKRYKKWVDGQIHKTDNHKLLCYAGNYFNADSVAAYSALDFQGKTIDLGPLN